MKGRKISVQVLGSALVIVLVWASEEFAKIKIPAEVAVALGTIAAVAISLLVPDDLEEE